MQNSFVLTLLGKDRPGLVESVSKLINDNGGNWLESRLCRLGGQFAGIVHATIPDSNLETWQKDLQTLEKDGLKILVADGNDKAVVPPSRKADFEIIGQDQPGIVRQITSELARHAVNVSEMRSHCSSAPWSGEMMFNFRAEVEIPDTCDVDTLRDDLDKIASDLMVDISFLGKKK